jgi:hypothetical protein
MAIKFAELDKELKEGPLTIEEKAIIERFEKQIDKDIKRQYAGNNSVTISDHMVEFTFDSVQDRQLNIPYARRVLMTKELLARYDKAGWRIKKDQGEDDGPNRPAMAYYIFTGKVDIGHTIYG